MLQSTLGVVWLGPLRHEFVIAGSSVVNAAPATFADAAWTRNGNDATAAMSVISLTAVHLWRRAPPESFLFIRAPSPMRIEVVHREAPGQSAGSGRRRLTQSTVLSQPHCYVPQARPSPTSVGIAMCFQQTAIA